MADGSYDWYKDELNRRISMPLAHSFVVTGDIFFASHTWTAVSSLATVGFVIETGADRPHGLFSINFGTSGDYRFYEMNAHAIASHSGCTIPGTALTVYNQNRDSDHASTTTCYYDPTVGNLSDDILEYGNAGGYDTHSASIAEGNISGYWNLKSSTTYIVWVKNTSISTGTFSVQFNWYE